MAKKNRNTLTLITKGFDEYIIKLRELEREVQPIVEKALDKGAKMITEDTFNALEDSYLPAQGEYSTGETLDSLILDPRTKWSGMMAEMNVGFDITKPGAGGLLITGTPKMAPDRELNRIYRDRKYANSVKKEMRKVVNEELEKRM